MKTIVEDTPAFFRDISSGQNLNDNREYHAAGVVLSRHDTGSESGKDLLVMFLDPFTGSVRTSWRADEDVETYPVDEPEWSALKERFEAIEAEG